MGFVELGVPIRFHGQQIAYSDRKCENLIGILMSHTYGIDRFIKQDANRKNTEGNNVTLLFGMKSMADKQWNKKRNNMVRSRATIFIRNYPILQS